MDAGYGEIRPFLHALDHRQQLFVAQIPESHCFWPATVALEKRGKPGGRPRRFPMIADPHAQPLSAKAWRQQAEAGKLRWQKVTLSSTAQKNGRGRCRPGPGNDHAGVAASGTRTVVTH